MARYAIVDPAAGKVVNVIDYDDPPTTPIPGLDPNLIAVYSDKAGPGWDYDGTNLIDPTPPPAPVVIVVSRTQALIALHRVGKLDAVKAAVATDPESQIWFDTAPQWHRDNPRIAALAPAVGLSDDDLDDLFELAKTVTA
jgi:hypothetical protein